MKNRKLFAILTLVAFMMTLLPVAAFAAITDGNADRFNSKIEWDKDKVSVTNVAAAAGNYKADNRIKVKVYTFEGQKQVNDNVYILSERGKIDKVEKKNGPDLTPDTNGVYTLKSEDGVAEFYIYSGTSGEAEFVVGLAGATEVYNYLHGLNDETANTAGIIGKKVITFESASVGDDAIDAAVETKGGSEVPEVSGKYDGNVVANGADYYLVTFKVASESGAPVAKEDVDFTLNKTGARLNKTSGTTNVAGEVEVKVYADKAGTYELKATADGESKTIKLVFDAGDVFGLEVVEAGKLTALDADYSFDIKLLNINNEKVKASDVTPLTDVIEFEVIEEPEDADIKDYIDVAPDADNYAEVTIPAKALDNEGEYLVRVTVKDTGKYVNVPFTVKKQGTVTGLLVTYDTKALALGSTSVSPTVKRVDAEGVTKKIKVADFGSLLKFSVNDTRTATVNSADGKVTATDDDKYAGKTVVITVVDTDKKVVGSAEMIIGVQPVGIEFDQADVVKVGESAKLYFDLVDADGNKISLGEDYTGVDATAYVLSKPANSMVSAEVSSDVAEDLVEKGRSYVEVSSNVEGTAKVQVVVEATFDSKDYVWTDSLTVNFGTPKSELPVIGAKNLTMFIGSTGFVADGVAQTMDQAPFIQDNRTFVPLRAVATALGATNEDTMWDPATQTITLVRPDLTVTMTIGSNVLTLSDGSTVVADVAPFIVAETGRTVIPFRAIAEAFGADVEAVFAADGTVTAVTFAQ